MNRSVVREIAEDPAYEVTVAVPRFFHGSLRPVRAEPEPDGSKLRLREIGVYLSKKIHLFFYHPSQLEKTVSEGGYDLVHIWEEPYIVSGYQTARAATRAGLPFFFWTCQNIQKKYPFPFGYFESRVARWQTGWGACGQTVFDVMSKKGFSNGRVITFSVDTKRFKPVSAREKSAVLERFGLRAPVICMMGRITEEKGISVLQGALEKLSGRDWNLFLIGSGEDRDKMTAWAEAKGWRDRLKIQLLNHGDVPQVLPAMDLLVAPSQTRPNWREQFGRMLVEAFACGVPVIGSDSGEIPHVIGDAGLVVGERDVDGWARAIGRVLDDPELRRELIAKGLQRAEHFSSANIAGQFKDFYRDLVGTRRRSAV